MLAASSSPAYKKARKQYLKSTRHRQPSDNSSAWTAFRIAEKKYMSKFPPPDLSNVLDLALLDQDRTDEIRRGTWKGNAEAIEVREIALNAKAQRRRAFCVPRIPGLIILPSYLSKETQKRLVRWCLSDHARQPNETNLDAHYQVPAEGLWSLHASSDKRPITRREHDLATVSSAREMSPQPKSPTAPAQKLAPATASELMRDLRWANIGWFYNWGTKRYELDRGRIDVEEPIRSICKEIVGSIDWSGVFGCGSPSKQRSAWGETALDWETWVSDYEPDAGIVNFYQYKVTSLQHPIEPLFDHDLATCVSQDTLMGHVDRAEICATSPLVSLSLGNVAVFLIGGQTKDEEPIAILLRSGDAIVMAGPGCRQAYHGVPRILEDSIPGHFDESEVLNPDWAVYSQYLRTARININMRQVFPKDFDPSQWTHEAQ